MRMHSLEKVEVIEREYKLINLRSNTSRYKNAQLFDNQVKSYFSTQSICTLEEANINGLYLVGDNLIAVDEGNRVYKLIDSEFSLIYTANDIITDIKSLVYNGQKAIYISQLSGQNVILYENGESESFNSVCGFYHLVMANTIFCANGDTVYFENLHNIKNLYKKAIGGNYIIMPDDAGEVVGLVEKDKGILIFCEKGIFKFTLFGESIEHSVKRLTCTNGKILSGSVKKMGEKILFIENNRLCELCENDSVKILDCSATFKDYEVLGKACDFNGKYAICISDDDNDKLLFIYDYNSMGEGIYSISSSLICDKGFIANGKEVEVLTDTRLTNGEWTSRALDLGTLCNKTLTGFYVDNKNDIELTVTTNYGNQTYRINADQKYKKLNLSSRLFTISLKGITGLDFSSIKFKFRIKGE